MEQLKTLHEIGLECNTDKATFHGYCNFYAKHFEQLRFEKFRFLEIGVWKSYSIKMWLEYFPNAEIHGIDYIPNTVPAPAHFHRVNCEIENELQEFSDKCGIFDIIIDDGGHTQLQQQLALKYLWSKASKFYVVEDLHTSFHPRLNNCNKENIQPVTYDYLKSLMSGQPRTTQILDADFNSKLLAEVKTIELYEKTPGIKNSGQNSSVTCLLKKF
jgi:hypothetical protein